MLRGLALSLVLLLPLSLGTLLVRAAGASQPTQVLSLSDYRGVHLLDLSRARSVVLGVAADSLAWSPDGAQFVSELRGDLFVGQREGRRIRPLVIGAAWEMMPTWSPDGSQIAYVARHERTGLGNLYLINVDGSDRRLLLDTDGAAAAPDWSPDGTRIAFHVRAPSTSGIYTIQPNGSGLTRLTEQLDIQPNWSPDGTQIVFSALEFHEFCPRDRSTIHVMAANGSNRRQLPFILGYGGCGRSYHPRWSPDGQWIAFESERNGSRAVVLMRPDGSDARTVSHYPGRQPEWLTLR